LVLNRRGLSRGSKSLQNKSSAIDSTTNNTLTPQTNILILNSNYDETELLSNLCSTAGFAYPASDVTRAIAHLEDTDIHVLVVDQALANYMLLKGLFKALTCVIITGDNLVRLEQIANEWPESRYTDYVISPYRKENHKDFFRALHMAIDHSKLKLELQNLRQVTELSEAEMRDAFVQIKELKSFINESVVSELEKRLAIEAKYKGFLKEKQKIYEILKRLYLANDVTKLLDISRDIKELVKAQSISLYILDENETLGKFLKPLVWDNHILSHPEIAKHTVLIDSPDFAAYTAVHGRVIRATEFTYEKGFSKRYREQLAFPLKCILSVPIKHDTEVIGVLEVYNKASKTNGEKSLFTLEDQEILQKISEHISIAITKLNLIQYDPLTGLLRPDPFIEKVILKLKSETKRQQEDVSYAMVMGDVDWFKNYNDRNGHEAGNDLLRALAEVLKSSIREEDLLCRYGGEEFLFFMSNISSREEALVITERIRKNVEKYYFEFQEFQPRNNLTMSFGITNFTKARFKSLDIIDKNEIKKIANEADLAMSEAKGKRIEGKRPPEGKETVPTKNRICVYYRRSPDDTKVKDVIMPYKEIYAQERRKHQRVFTSTILIYKINGVPFVSKTINLSLSGAKISTEKPLNRDDVFDIILLLGNKACQCDALVVYSERESGNLPFYHSGLRFGALTFNERKVLEDYFAALSTRTPATSQ